MRVLLCFHVLMVSSHASSRHKLNRMHGMCPVDQNPADYLVLV